MKCAKITREVKGVDLLQLCTTILEDGGVLAVPTDTVYGLVADASHTRAVGRLFAIKQRDPKKPTPLFIHSIAATKKVAHISKKQEAFLTNVWPGAITAVCFLKETAQLDKRVTAKKEGKRTVALRIPDTPFLTQLLSSYKKPLAQTSANPSSLTPALSAQEVMTYFDNQAHKPDLIIESRKKMNATPSTIIDVTETPWVILRKGVISKKLAIIFKNHGVLLQ
ncbi:MAG: threonylcarbamoyl-AMP synthase [Parcubacteria group bacterium]|nr:threonylcarbamoyl-AMP synthase [Parcubacteria group bacterium]